MTTEFEEFPKIARLSREIIITEKIDGTNAQVCITEDGQVLAGSRTRWITPEADNYGFAKWVKDHEDELRALGHGRHFGEWWGQGVQRKYGMDEKRFSLFNVGRWVRDDGAERAPLDEKQEYAPHCCHVVPVIYQGQFSDAAIDGALNKLRENGSMAAPGFMNPEGIVVFHSAARTMFKKTLEKDEMPKGLAA